MAKKKRKIIRIDEEKCDGCGQCVIACAEGAIEIAGGKARLVSEKYCDGLGACLGKCPQGAITIEEREAEDFDEEATKQHLASEKKSPPCACPSMAFARDAGDIEPPSPGEPASSAKSMLGQWPVQLMLLGAEAPVFHRPGGIDLVIVADCVPFAYADFHRDFLRGKPLVVGCPKLDDAELYIEKLAEIFRAAEIKSLTVIHMEVPCCFGLQRIVAEALSASGKDIPIKEVTISIDGRIT